MNMNKTQLQIRNDIKRIVLKNIYSEINVKNIKPHLDNSVAIVNQLITYTMIQELMVKYSVYFSSLNVLVISNRSVSR